MAHDVRAREMDEGETAHAGQDALAFDETALLSARQIDGQKSEALTGFLRRSHEDDSLHGVALERVDGAGNGEVRLARSGGPYSKRDVVRLDRLQIRDLVRRASVQIGAPRAQRRKDV